MKTTTGSCAGLYSEQLFAIKKPIYLVCSGIRTCTMFTIHTKEKTKSLCGMSEQPPIIEIPLGHNIWYASNKDQLAV